VTFTLVHAWKYRTEDKLKNTDITETKHNPEKANNAKRRDTKLSWFSRLLRHSSSKRGGLILQRSQAWERCRISPPRLLDECRKNDWTRIVLFCCVFALFAFSGLCLVSDETFVERWVTKVNKNDWTKTNTVSDGSEQSHNSCKVTITVTLISDIDVLSLWHVAEGEVTRDVIAARRGVSGCYIGRPPTQRVQSGRVTADADQQAWYVPNRKVYQLFHQCLSIHHKHRWPTDRLTDRLTTGCPTDRLTIHIQISQKPCSSWRGDSTEPESVLRTIHNFIQFYPWPGVNSLPVHYMCIWSRSYTYSTFWSFISETNCPEALIVPQVDEGPD